MSNTVCTMWYLFIEFFSAPEMNQAGGIYINNCFPCQPSKTAMNEEARRRLWESSIALLHERGHSVN